MVPQALHEMSPFPLQPQLSHGTPPCPSHPRPQPAGATHSSPCHPGHSLFLVFCTCNPASQRCHLSPGPHWLSIFRSSITSSGKSPKIFTGFVVFHFLFHFALLAPWAFLILCENNTPVSLPVCLPRLRPEDEESAWFISALPGPLPQSHP